MEKEAESVVSLEIRSGTVYLFSTESLYQYSTETFLCEIYEKLTERFEHGVQSNEFFNYADPKSAWQLLSDYFEKTNYLKKATLENFDDFRSFYGIGIEYKKGESSDRYRNINSVLTLLAFERFSKELDKWRILDKQAIEESEFDPNVFRYYSCRTMVDFVFSLVHYCVYNRYSISKCAHCGRYFSTSNLKVKYCSRPSPFPEYGDYSCAEAVKAIKDKMEKKRLAEYERLRWRADEYRATPKYTDTFNSFCEKCSEYKEKIKKGASVELLLEYQNFLFNSPEARPKYVRIKNW